MEIRESKTWKRKRTVWKVPGKAPNHHNSSYLQGSGTLETTCTDLKGMQQNKEFVCLTLHAGRKKKILWGKDVLFLTETNLHCRFGDWWGVLLNCIRKDCIVMSRESFCCLMSAGLKEIKWSSMRLTTKPQKLPVGDH